MSLKIAPAIQWQPTLLSHWQQKLLYKFWNLFVDKLIPFHKYFKDFYVRLYPFVLFYISDPSSVTDLFISSITDSSATVQWTHAVGSRDRYEITLIPTPKRMRKTMPIRTKNNDITFSTLEAGITYTMRIRTIAGKFESEIRTLLITPGVDKPLSMHRARGIKVLCSTSNRHFPYSI